MRFAPFFFFGFDANRTAKYRYSYLPIKKNKTQHRCNPSIFRLRQFPIITFTSQSVINVNSPFQRVVCSISRIVLPSAVLSVFSSIYLRLSYRIIPARSCGERWWHGRTSASAILGPGHTMAITCYNAGSRRATSAWKLVSIIIYRAPHISRLQYKAKRCVFEKSRLLHLLCVLLKTSTPGCLPRSTL